MKPPHDPTRSLYNVLPVIKTTMNRNSHIRLDGILVPRYQPMNRNKIYIITVSLKTKIVVRKPQTIIFHDIPNGL